MKFVRILHAKDDGTRVAVYTAAHTVPADPIVRWQRAGDAPSHCLFDGTGVEYGKDDAASGYGNPIKAAATGVTRRVPSLSVILGALI